MEVEVWLRLALGLGQCLLPEDHVLGLWPHELACALLHGEVGEPVDGAATGSRRTGRQQVKQCLQRSGVHDLRISVHT